MSLPVKVETVKTGLWEKVRPECGVEGVRNTGSVGSDGGGKWFVQRMREWKYKNKSNKVHER